jgi:hypothetical protein
MFKNYPLLKIIPVLALGALMSACDSGSVGTTSNPNLSGNGGNRFVYTGPPANSIEISNFQFYLWRNVIDPTRCGGCHNSEASSPETPLFFDTSNVNLAYAETVARDPSLLDMSTVNPVNTVFVQKLLNTHACWETNSAICATLIEGWIDDWKNAANGGVASRQINLTAPAVIRDPGDAKSFPATAFTVGTNGTSFATTVYPLLVGTDAGFNATHTNCQRCHDENAPPPAQAPFFANDARSDNSGIEAAYQAAKSKMNIDSPADSRFVARLLEGHNFWNEQVADAALMTNRITAFANGIAPTSIDPTLVTSKALTLPEGIVASGGNRAETNQFALWEFKTGRDRTAFDTSGVGNSINLTLLGSVTWVGGYGLEFSGGRAQADTVASDKIFTYLQDTGEYAIEAWVIPSNVSQEDANIVSYSGGDLTRNFTLGQNMYNYEAYNRVAAVPPASPAPNGDPFLTTGENGLEIAQASLQHVVVNYDPLDRVGNGAGRSIYVNGVQVPGLTDPVPSPTSINAVWDDSFAFILGNETSGNRPWMGQVKMVALHSRALSLQEITDNFDVGVGQKFFLLFHVGDIPEGIGLDTGNPNSFIMFEVAQFDSYSYLFNKPTFINLDPAWTPPANINIRGLRIGINGKEALAGQAFASLDTAVTAAAYDPALGQQLSPMGTIISLEKGPDLDEFFLTFEDFNGDTKTFADIVPSVAADPDDPASPVESDIGMRTFEEINSTIAEITGVPVTNAAVKSVYDDYIQQLPTVEAIDAFLPSHQMAIAQLALTSCSELVDGRGSILPAAYFPGFNFGNSSQSAFDAQGERDAIIEPLLTRAMNVDQVTPANNLMSQPVELEVADLLSSPASQSLDTGQNIVAYDSLITEMLSDLVDTPARTEQIVKAVCAVATGGAVMLVQ